MAKLLLVEDDNNLREIYEARLQAEGYTIVSAKDGEEALVVAKAEKPDLVISDVMMPKISGFEMLDILRNTEELKGVKVIMLTALGQSDDQQRADKLGADRYLVKSQVTLEDIVKVTHELLGDQSGASGGAADAGSATPDPAATDATTAAPTPATNAKSDDAVVEPPPEPAPAPAPAPAPEPKSEPKPDGTPTNEAAKSTVQEEADVDAKIEDFVAGATSEPTKPGTDTSGSGGKTDPDPSPAPVPADDQKGDGQTQGSDSANDDKLMADAVESLVASTDDGKSSTAPAGGATTIPVNTEPDEEKAPPPKVDDSPAEPVEPAAPASDSGDGGSTGGRKIIKPLDSAPKKDITQLLAEEEAKEVQTTPGATIVGTTTASETEDRAAGEPMLPPSAAAEKTGPETQAKPETDPGSIAL